MPEINNNYKYIRDNHESLFTILVWSTSSETVLKDLKKRLDNVKEIKNTFKKTKLNDRIYKLITNIELKKLESLNFIILVSDEIKFIKLSNDDIKLLEEFSIPKYSFDYDNYFKIDWLKDLFENFNFYDVIINNNNIFSHIKGNLNKKKTIIQTSSIEYIRDLTIPIYFIGKLPSIIKINKLIDHIPVNITWLQIIEHINRLDIQKKNNKLKEHIDNLSLNPDIYIYKNEISEYIEMYNIKELFVHKFRKEMFEEMLVKNKLTENINFDIVVVESVDNKNKDISDDFLNNFDGLLGIKYF